MNHEDKFFCIRLKFYFFACMKMKCLCGSFQMNIALVNILAGIGSSVYSSVSSGTDLLITLKNAGISGAMQLFFSGLHTGLYGGFTDLDSIGKIWIELHKYACDIGGSTVFGDLIINSVNQKHKNSNSKNNIEKK
ncbi:hypothetical protein SAMN02910429_02008 [Lachnobacterium bovis]|uniref:Uncharacterized protein n=2 Tax=Lachnobacterium bovis TaxID=140626 RepID=A0A1H9UAF9_9FIRM|nr:hypothetical protein SAMN02910429_02008 [Lachnobacterium bovis]